MRAASMAGVAGRASPPPCCAPRGGRPSRYASPTDAVRLAPALQPQPQAPTIALKRIAAALSVR
eukprot:566159-Prymnesium_polylepis.1